MAHAEIVRRLDRTYGWRVTFDDGKILEGSGYLSSTEAEADLMLHQLSLPIVTDIVDENGLSDSELSPPLIYDCTSVYGENRLGGVAVADDQIVAYVGLADGLVSFVQDASNEGFRMACAHYRNLWFRLRSFFIECQLEPEFETDYRSVTVELDAEVASGVVPEAASVVRVHGPHSAAFLDWEGQPWSTFVPEVLHDEGSWGTVPAPNRVRRRPRPNARIR